MSQMLYLYIMLAVIITSTCIANMTVIIALATQLLSL